MPIKKHVVKIEKDNMIQIPKTIADAIGLGENSVVRCYSNGNGYSFTVETVPSYESVVLLQEYKTVNEELREKIKQLESENQKLRENK